MEKLQRHKFLYNILNSEDTLTQVFEFEYRNGKRTGEAAFKEK